MRNVMSAVKEFMEGAGNTFPNRPWFPPHFARKLRIKLLEEEFQEYLDGESADDLAEIADALADMTYIIAGTALDYGIPLDKIFEEVHRTNMAKFVDGKLVLRDDGKVLKPDGWSAPDIEQILIDAGWAPPLSVQIRREEDARIRAELAQLVADEAAGKAMGEEVSRNIDAQILAELTETAQET